MLIFKKFELKFMLSSSLHGFSFLRVIGTQMKYQQIFTIQKKIFTSPFSIFYEKNLGYFKYTYDMRSTFV